MWGRDVGTGGGLCDRNDLLSIPRHDKKTNGAIDQHAEEDKKPIFKRRQTRNGITSTIQDQI
jgi:hypothetical protein